MHRIALTLAVAGLIATPVLAEDAMHSSSMMSNDAMGAMSSDAMGSSAMGSDAMGSDAMGSNAMGSNAMGSDSMGGDAMMTATKAGEVVAIMPSGQMGTAMMEGDKMQMTIGMSQALGHCVMFITGADGKVYQVDTSSDKAQAECEGIAK